MKTSEQLIHRIMSEESRPVPRWMILLKSKLLLAVFITAILLGGISTSVILLAIQQSDFNITAHLSHSRMEMILGILPFIWVPGVILGLIVSMYAIMNSRRGYKFTLTRLFLDSAALSIMIGILFFIAGGTAILEHTFALNVTTYESIQQKKMEIWSRPDDGFLSGTISSIEGDIIQLRDFNDNDWAVGFTEAFIPPAVLLEPGEVIKIVGSKKGKGEFVATEIRPWGGRHVRSGPEPG